PAIDLTYASFSLLITYDNSQGVLTEDYVGPFGREMDKQEPDFEFGSADPVTVDGVAGYEIILLPIYEDTDHIGIEAFAIKGNALLYYQEIIDIDGYETSKAKADSIIATIKIK
ncbi:MAG: hypothetical protein HOC95_02285, partial [Candidatus Diapherotrites archaeon]|nr:hypothetical protein [Candidatus Diapherotrites archaeon]